MGGGKTVALSRLEILAALTPKKWWRGEWRPGPRNIRFRYHVRAWCSAEEVEEEEEDDDYGQFGFWFSCTLIESIMVSLQLPEFMMCTLSTHPFRTDRS